VNDVIRKYLTRNVLTLVVLDQAVLVAALAAALWIKRHWLFPDPLLPVSQHLDLFLRLWPFLALSLVLAGAYDLQLAVQRLRPVVRRTLKGSLVLAGVWIAGTFYLKMGELVSYSRAVFTLFLVLATAGLLANRLLLAKVSRAWRSRHGQFRRVLVFGGETFGRKVIRNLEQHVFAPFKVIGVTGAIDWPGVPRLSEEQALGMIRQGEVDSIVADLPLRRIRLLFRVARLAEREGVPLQVTGAIAAGLHLKPSVGQIGSVPVIELTSQEIPLSGVVLKRTMDLVLSLAGLAVIWPLMLAIALAVKLSSRGPVLYRQVRVGLDGRSFTMYKFRTMGVDAERDTGPKWAEFEDRRATPVGLFLRRYGLDELPQLFNVIRGEMSLVGPRPERPEFVEQFKPLIERYSHKHWVRPGITGWAQVNGWRGPTDLQRRIEHDIYYIERWSLIFDLRILTMTLARCCRGTY